MPKTGTLSGYRPFVRAISKSRASIISEIYLSKSDEVCIAINAPIFRDKRVSLNLRTKKGLML